MDVDQAGGLSDGYELKLNSYDLGVDIELNDAVQRLRFEHPEVRCVVIKSGKDNVFCAGANIRMLGKATHGHKVNFCKFTNETRLAIEDASENSKQTYVCAINGNAAGGGYELALAADHIMLVDDRRSAVALPETPLLAVLPGTGGLTRVTDKRKVRRDRADVFCSIEEGIRGAQSGRMAAGRRGGAQFEMERDGGRARAGDRRALRPAERRQGHHADAARAQDRGRPRVLFACRRRDRPRARACDRHRARAVAGACRLRSKPRMRSAPSSGRSPSRASWKTPSCICAPTRPPSASCCSAPTAMRKAVLEHDDFLAKANGDWLMREIRHYLKRVLKRVDVTAKSFIALIEPGSCFAGTLAELAFAADRSLMLIGTREGDNRKPAAITLGQANFGFYPMGNGLTRLQTRFLGEPDTLDTLKGKIGAADRRRGGRRARPRHRGLRGFRLGRRIARHAGGAHQLLARRHDRHGSESALRRPGDDGNQDLRTADRLAELDLPAAERDRRAGRAEALRQRRVADLRQGKGVAMNIASAVDYDGLIPNNVALGQDVRVKRALEKWHPGYIDWWNDMGPEGFQESLVYLRTAVSVDPEGLGQVRLCAHAGIPLGRAAGAAASRAARFRSARTRARTPGRKCRANTAPCCAA